MKAELYAACHMVKNVLGTHSVENAGELHQELGSPQLVTIRWASQGLREESSYDRLGGMIRLESECPPHINTEGVACC